MSAEFVEEPPGGLDGGQVLFLLGTFASSGEANRHAFQSSMTDGRSNSRIRRRAPKRGQLLPQLNRALPLFRCGLVRLAVRSARMFLQFGRTAAGTAEPFADGRNGGLEESSGGHDATASGRVHHSERLSFRE